AVCGTRSTKVFSQATNPASSSLRACTLRLPSVIPSSAFSSLKLSASAPASALTIARRTRSWISLSSCTGESARALRFFGAAVPATGAASWSLRAGLTTVASRDERAEAQVQPAEAERHPGVRPGRRGRQRQGADPHEADAHQRHRADRERARRDHRRAVAQHPQPRQHLQRRVREQRDGQRHRRAHRRQEAHQELAPGSGGQRRTKAPRLDHQRRRRDASGQHRGDQPHPQPALGRGLLRSDPRRRQGDRADADAAPAGHGGKRAAALHGLADEAQVVHRPLVQGDGAVGAVESEGSAHGGNLCLGWEPVKHFAKQTCRADPWSAGRSRPPQSRPWVGSTGPRRHNQTFTSAPGHPAMPTRKDPSRTIRAPRGPELSCKSWLTEAPFRMLQNNLDPDMAENPAELVVYGGIGRAARNWECFDAILESLRTLEDTETLLVQSGKPVGIFPTHPDAPRVLIANSNLVPHWATWEHFNELDRKGLMMYGQMTAGSWIYIGSQGIVQGTYETFVEMGRQHYGGDLTGKWILTAGLGGMGGAQPLAASLAGACSLTIECQQSRIDFRLKTRYVDEQARDLDDALARIKKYTKAGEAKSLALLCNAAVVLPERVKRGVRTDAVTDQTSANAPVHGYLPVGWTVEACLAEQETNPKYVRDEAKKSMRVHVEAMLAFQKLGIPVFDYGNNIRQMAFDEGCENAFDFPGFVPAFVRPLFCKGIGPFRWVALSGDPADI